MAYCYAMKCLILQTRATSLSPLRTNRNHAQDEDEHVKNEAIKSIQRWNHQGRMVAQYILNFLKSADNFSRV